MAATPVKSPRFHPLGFNSREARPPSPGPTMDQSPRGEGGLDHASAQRRSSRGSVIGLLTAGTAALGQKLLDQQVAQMWAPAWAES